MSTLFDFDEPDKDENDNSRNINRNNNSDFGTNNDPDQIRRIESDINNQMSDQNSHGNGMDIEEYRNNQDYRIPTNTEREILEKTIRRENNMDGLDDEQKQLEKEIKAKAINVVLGMLSENKDYEKILRTKPDMFTEILADIGKAQLLKQVTRLRNELDMVRKEIEVNDWESDTVNQYQSQFAKDFDVNNDINYDMFYTNSFHKIKKSLMQYDSYIMNIGPVLSDYIVTVAKFKGSDGWCSIHHEPGTMFILGKMFPYYRFSTPKVVLNNDSKIRGIQLKMQSLINPKVVYYYYGVPGVTESGNTRSFGVGSQDKTTYTYAEKFSNVFNFLKTYNINHNYSGSADMFINSLNEYKGFFDKVHPRHKFVFNLILDAIGHAYLDNGTIPDNLTTKTLLEFLPVSDLYNDKFVFMKDEEVKKLPYYDETMFPPYFKYPREHATAYYYIYGLTVEAKGTKLPRGIRVLRKFTEINN